jgi:hypothetical protein
VTTTELPNGQHLVNVHTPVPRCGTHARRVPPQHHPAVALVYSHGGRYSHPLCESTLNHWLDNADDDPDLEPADIVWLNGPRHRP